MKTPWLKYCTRIINAAGRTYFKWDNIALILHTVLALDVVFYVFNKKLYHCDNVWWIMGKHIGHVTVDFDMDAEEDIKTMKTDLECRKRFLIETDLGYTPTFDIGCLNETKKGKKLLM